MESKPMAQLIDFMVENSIHTMQTEQRIGIFNITVIITEEEESGEDTSRE